MGKGYEFLMKNTFEAIAGVAINEIEASLGRHETNILKNVEAGVTKFFANHAYIDRKYNLSTSIVAALYFNGELVGQKGNKFQRYRKYRTKADDGIHKTKTAYIPNPFFSSMLYGSVTQPWRGGRAIEGGTGAQFAERMLCDYTSKARNTSGYHLFVGIAMPYATAHNLSRKTDVLFIIMKDMLGKGQKSKIAIETTSTAFNY